MHLTALATFAFEQRSTRIKVPEPHGRITGSTHKLVTVRAELHRDDWCTVTSHGACTPRYRAHTKYGLRLIYNLDRSLRIGFALSDGFLKRFQDLNIVNVE